MERIRHLEKELSVANEVIILFCFVNNINDSPLISIENIYILFKAASRLQKELEDANNKLKKGDLTPAGKKKAPMLGSIPKTPSGEVIIYLLLLNI
jgi:hypothetical protein